MNYPSLSLSQESIEIAFAVKKNSAKKPSFKDKFSNGDDQKCEKCDYRTSKHEHMRQHMVTKHSGVKHKCAYCDYTHYYPSTIKTHESQVHKKIARISGKENMVCNDKQCPHFFTKECKEIENHGRHFCTKCEYTTKRTADLKVHIQSVHEGVVFSCEECHYSDLNKRRLTKHIRSVHEGVIFSCDECQFSSKEKRRLNQHIQAVHEGEKPNKCNQCDMHPLMPAL